MDTLIFIDTNILLDFYRIRNFDTRLKFLHLIDDNHDKIITSTQVEMEYKKNRQIVILSTINELKVPNFGSLTLPAILDEMKVLEPINRNKSQINLQYRKIKERIIEILENPTIHDKVYKVLQRLFENGSEINLRRDNAKRFKIRNLSKKRFILGYPPRKKNDNSIGDAMNWEWIVDCAESTGKDIIIVSRDSDYGVFYDKKVILNDWLNQEFQERIRGKRKIILTDKLYYAFQQVNIEVTKEMEIEENRIIMKTSEKSIFQKAMEQRELFDSFEKLFSNINNEKPDPN